MSISYYMEFLTMLKGTIEETKEIIYARGRKGTLERKMCRVVELSLSVSLSSLRVLLAARLPVQCGIRFSSISPSLNKSIYYLRQ